MLNIIDPYDYSSNSTVTVISATTMSLIVFDELNLSYELNLETTYNTMNQTGKKSDHLVTVVFTSKTVKGLKYLTNN